MMRDQRPTVADLLAIKGKRQLSMLRVESLEEAEAAQRAGIDLLSVPPGLLGPEFREAVPTCFVFPGLDYGEYVTEDEYLRAAFKALKAGGDAVWCAASLRIIRRLREEGVPVCGHVGLIPDRRTWTGGFKAVGRTLESALLVWRQTKALEEAGAFSAEIEVVPTDVASAISRRTALFLISMGSGAGCDAQYLFATDVLGTNRGHVPRHSKVYRNFAAEYDRLQQERIAAFSELLRDIRSGAYPETKHQVGIPKAELDQFLRALENE
jgi:3-methyl-2-oxobutanoate hydroxymethyltransferase